MLQRNEDIDRNDFDYGGTSQYLMENERPYLTASLMMPGMARSCHFLDEAYHHFGTYGYRDCVLLDGEIYQLRRGLHHEFLRGVYKAKVDRGSWVQIEDIINEDGLWELLRHGHEHRGIPGKRICYDSKNMAGQTPSTAEELMHHRT